MANARAYLRAWIGFSFPLALWLILLPYSAAALTVEEVALLKAPDRQKVLEDGAKKEGKLLWYTTLIVNQALRPIKEAFEKKYPYVQIEHYRADSDALAQRIMAEYQAKRFDIDIVDGTSTTAPLKKAGYLQRFVSPQLRDYPPQLKDAEPPLCLGNPELFNFFWRFCDFLQARQEAHCKPCTIISGQLQSVLLYLG